MARWILKEVDPVEVRDICDNFGIPKIAGEIILRRKIENVEDFLNPTDRLVHDPYTLRDMEKAVDILVELWKEKKPVLIHGDYDVDGITGVAILYLFMKKLGWKVEYFIPDRLIDGYGISVEAVADFAKRGGKALLTVDCGTTAFEPISEIKKLGLRVIITDHHETLGELPPADAVINPHRKDEKYPFKELAGVGVAYKLLQALADRFGIPKGEVYSYLDLVALGTVADMVMLTGENRFYVKQGLKLLGKKRPGLKKLVEKLSLREVGSKDISYKIAPKLNAAGRMGSANDAFKLLISEDEREAENMVSVLFNHNLLRQEIESDIFSEAVKLIISEKLDKSPLILVAGENWHLGVIGIVASKIANKFKKPALVVSFNDGVGKGSARSYNNQNILEIFHSLEDYFIEYGGHSMAVGFTIEKEKYNELLSKVKEVEIRKTREVVEVDAQINLKDVNPELFEVINLFEPYGLGNPPLKFLLRDLDVIKVGFFNEGDSANIVLKNGRNFINAVWHGMGYDNSLMLKHGAVKVDVVGEIEPDFLNPKLKVVDMKFKCGIDEIDSLVGIKIEERIDKEELVSKKRVNEILWEDYEGGVIFSDIRTITAILRKLVKELDNIFVVGVCKQVVEHYYRSLLRHEDVDRNIFLTVSEFLEKAGVKGTEFIVVLEPAHILLFYSHDKVKDFVKAIRTFRKISIGLKMPENVKKILKEMSFKKLRANFKKLDVAIQDLRGKKYKIQKNPFIVITQRPEKFSKYTGGNYYSHELNKFQRASVVNLIKRGHLKKFAATPSTDGLPTFIHRADVVFLTPPSSLLEIVDSVDPVYDEHDTTLVLNYTEVQVYDGDELSVAYSEYTKKLAEGDVKRLLKILKDPKEII